MISIKSVFVASALCLSTLCAAAVSIVPAPQSMMQNEGTFNLGSDVKIVVDTDDFMAVAKTWKETLSQSVQRDRMPAISKISNRSAKNAGIKILYKEGMQKEEYALVIDQNEGVIICASEAAGAWWALQTLTQVILQNEDGFNLPCITVKDSPKFSYRGAMLDCSRHFYTVQEVKTYIDMIALHKLNTFHWHLTDDQGWRIEIKKYPMLTKVGSTRAQTAVGHHGEAEKKYDGTPHSGFYTQEEIKDIVKYAAKRQITIIPEIEMPGHSLAALASYPELGCRGEAYAVSPDWGIFEDVYCLGKEHTYEFLQDVLDEVCKLFPSEYVHIGGDEAPRARWEVCPLCQAKMKAEGLENEAQLQGYLVNKIEKYLNAKGRKLIGWDEILDCGISQTATVMSWRGPKGGIAAAKRGNNVVMTPNTSFYLDYYQTSDPKANGEPLGIGGCLPLKKCYAFEPYDQLTEDESSHIVGIQANLWCEYVAKFDHVQHMVLPRFTALSEIAWTGKKTAYYDFLYRVWSGMLPAYRFYGYKYAPYAFTDVK